MLRFVYNVTFPETKPRLILINQSIARSQERAGQSPTITTGTRCYLSHRCRLVRGQEAFAMQGIHYAERHTELADVSESLLMDMAGNAFHAWCCGAALLATLTLLAEAAATGKQEDEQLAADSLESMIYQDDVLDYFDPGVEDCQAFWVCV